MCNLSVKVKGKAVPVQAWTGPQLYRMLRLLELLESRHLKAVRSILRTGRLYLQGRSLVLISITD